MSWRRGLSLCGAALLAALAACSSEPEPAATAEPAPAAVAQGDGFDFYVLALSWSPSYCEAEGAEANRQQCGGRPYEFVVHGLWPQFERGYPENCRTDAPADVPREQMAKLYDLMPSSGLIRYQWRKHGSCAGLSQEDYFDVLRAARARVEIPADYQRLKTYRTVDPAAVETAFRAANASLPADGIAVTCDQRYLREVRICLTKGLTFRSCPEVDRSQCRSRSVVMPPVRGS